MQYAIRVRKGHPIGIYRRSGRVFQVNADVVLDESELTDAIRDDAWLELRPLETERARRGRGKRKAEPDQDEEQPQDAEAEAEAEGDAESDAEE
jgi:hypothetical protein